MIAIRQKADFVADFRKPQVGIVLAKQEPVFGPGREHPVRLDRSLGDQIVNQNADVCLVAPKDNGIQCR